MICDTPAILDPECRVCPKLEELEGLLGELLEEPRRWREDQGLTQGINSPIYGGLNMAPARLIAWRGRLERAMAHAT
jgi:hypothetical protein